jgi:hypothetical protein
MPYAETCGWTLPGRSGRSANNSRGFRDVVAGAVSTARGDSDPQYLAALEPLVTEVIQDDPRAADPHTLAPCSNAIVVAWCGG